MGHTQEGEKFYSFFPESYGTIKFEAKQTG